jgi:hypothetical protein
VIEIIELVNDRVELFRFHSVIPKRNNYTGGGGTFVPLGRHEQGEPKAHKERFHRSREASSLLQRPASRF